MGAIAENLRAGADLDPAAGTALFELIYPELKRLAHNRLWRHGGVEELNTTMLVHESYLKFVQSGSMSALDRPAFFAYVGRVMRSVVVDYVRERQSACRGGDVQRIALTTSIAGEAIDSERVLAIDLALSSLQRMAPELRELVDMRYFAGLSVREIAELRGVSTRTVEREWERARAFLRKLMDEED